MYSKNNVLDILLAFTRALEAVQEVSAEFGEWPELALVVHSQCVARNDWGDSQSSRTMTQGLIAPTHDIVGRQAI